MTHTEQTETATDGFVDRSRRVIILGIVACVVLVAGFGGWASSARLSGAVVTSGSVIVASELKAVQHPDGGIVGDIRVANGDRVAAGDVVITLDDKLLKANRALVDDQLVALDAKLARLVAEREGAADLVPSEELAARKAEPKVTQALASQRAVMEARSITLDGEVAALHEQVAQIKEEIAGLEAQRVAKDDEVALIDAELAGLETLFAKGLVPETRITALKRERTGLLGASGSFTSQIAVAHGRISELNLRILQTEKTFREQVMHEVSALKPEIGQLRERRAAVDLQLSRVEIRAPAGGVVHELAVHTVGGVVAPGATLMRIVPEADSLVVTAAIAPKDINNVSVGQDAGLIIGAFDQKLVSRLQGTVSFVSADLRTDPATGMSHYEARVALDGSAADLLAERDLALLPGMPAEVYIATGDRTMAEYLLDPLTKQLRNTFREP